MKYAALLSLFVLTLASGPAIAYEPDSSVSITAGGAGSLSDESAVFPLVSLMADGPLYFGDDALLRARATLSLNALPGETVDLAQVETFKAATLRVELQRRIGADSEVTKDADGKSHTAESATYVFARGGYSTRILPQDLAPRDRFAREWCGGIRAERRLDNDILRSIGVAYGRSEVASPEPGFGKGQLIVDGFARVAHAGAADSGVDFIIGGSAALNVGRDVIPRARDVMQVYVAVQR